MTDPANLDTNVVYDGSRHATKVTAASIGTEGYKAEYDSGGRVTKTIDPLLKNTTYAYDSAGNLTATTDPNGLISYTYYDSSGRMTQQIEPAPRNYSTYYYYADGCGGCSATSNATSTQNTWYDVYVRCDGANITVYRAERGSGSEMTQVLSTSSSAVDGSGFLKLTTYGSFRFDDLRMASDVLSTTTTYTYTNANKLSTSTNPSDGSMTYGYDTWGRMCDKVSGGGDWTAYTYRYDSKLCTVTSTIPDESDVVNNYDGVGKLRSITTGGATKKLRWDAGWHPINLEDANGNLTATFVHDPAREAAGSVLAAHVGSNPESGGTWAYLSQDHLGSTRHLRGQDRASLGTYEYTPYGDPYIATGMDLPQKFTGHWQVPQAGFYYTPYREYAPGLSRWLTRDPVGTAAGQNLYSYVQGRPLKSADPLGLQSSIITEVSRKCVDAVLVVLHDLSNQSYSEHGDCPISWHGARTVEVRIMDPFTSFVTGMSWSLEPGSMTINYSTCEALLEPFDFSPTTWEAMRAWAVGRKGLYHHIAHEHGHSISSFSRWDDVAWPPLYNREEDYAQSVADKCVKLDSPSPPRYWGNCSAYNDAGAPSEAGWLRPLLPGITGLLGIAFWLARRRLVVWRRHATLP